LSRPRPVCELHRLFAEGDSIVIVFAARWHASFSTTPAISSRPGQPLAGGSVAVAPSDRW
jgi:hypothetical protein